jgi:hypothetical protein
MAKNIGFYQVRGSHLLFGHLVPPQNPLGFDGVADEKSSRI